MTLAFHSQGTGGRAASAAATPQDQFWSQATLSTVALSVAAGEARAAAKHDGARDSIVSLCDELATLAGEDEGKLVGSIARSLGEFARDAHLDEPALEVIAGHLEALRAVVRHAISGDGGTVGRAIMAGLQASVQRHAA